MDKTLFVSNSGSDVLNWFYKQIYQAAHCMFTLISMNSSLSSESRFMSTVSEPLWLAAWFSGEPAAMLLFVDAAEAFIAVVAVEMSVSLGIAEVFSVWLSLILFTLVAGECFDSESCNWGFKWTSYKINWDLSGVLSGSFTSFWGD